MVGGPITPRKVLPNGRPDPHVVAEGHGQAHVDPARVAGAAAAGLLVEGDRVVVRRDGEAAAVVRPVGAGRPLGLDVHPRVVAQVRGGRAEHQGVRGRGHAGRRGAAGPVPGPDGGGVGEAAACVAGDHNPEDRGSAVARVHDRGVGHGGVRGVAGAVAVGVHAVGRILGRAGVHRGVAVRAVAAERGVPAGAPGGPEVGAGRAVAVAVAVPPVVGDDDPAGTGQRGVADFHGLGAVVGGGLGLYDRGGGAVTGRQNQKQGRHGVLPENEFGPEDGTELK